ncbi:molybdate ABC transporter substrate-binding protein [Flammeovirga pacifica]|uniref:Molybdate ABC transporter substrate-binding protein n=1 Tax=Flammeovirga pacifica TaxID=915059 RepID=A0A1S1YVW5_FLAPC|nr:molybdate ABC transporter substrate-binding protein [Flammeovirga pacifica]OHX65154.1 molybdate ABC transporter substrate-binding protein [Flammeovirga pacifica]
MNRLFTLPFIILLLLFGCQKPQEKVLRIAVSANMAFVMKELSNTYTEKYGIPCELIIGSSGKLSHQINNGAPYDVFISADMKYPTLLYEQDRTTSSPKIYTYGTLVLWSTKHDDLNEINMLNNTKIEKIGVANPKTAPYGIAAMSVCADALSKSTIKDKIVFGESISQINQYIVNQAVDVGFTSLFIVNSEAMKNKGHWIKVNPSLYRPIAQGGVVIKNNQEEIAEEFLNWMLNDEGQKIINGYKE